MKQRVAIVAIEFLIDEHNHSQVELKDVMEHVEAALDTHHEAVPPMRYADHKIIDARLVRQQ